MLLIQLICYLLKKLIDTIIIFSTSLFDDFSLDCFCELMSLFEVYLSLLCQITFIPYQGYYQVWNISILPQVLDPVLS